jgi:uncharacterized protein YbjQ (UPF0145 family)
MLKRLANKSSAQAILRLESGRRHDATTPNCPSGELPNASIDPPSLGLNLTHALRVKWIDRDLPDNQRRPQVIIVTTENVTGHRTVRMVGQCFGVVVRSRGLGGNLMAGLRSIVGGEIHEYTQMLEEARRHALDRLVQNATQMGANAVLMMRFDSAEIGNTMSEIVAYGTAAVIEPAP